MPDWMTGPVHSNSAHFANTVNKASNDGLHLQYDMVSCDITVVVIASQQGFNAQLGTVCIVFPSPPTIQEHEAIC